MPGEKLTGALILGFSGVVGMSTAWFSLFRYCMTNTGVFGLKVDLIPSSQSIKSVIRPITFDSPVGQVRVLIGLDYQTCQAVFIDK